MRRREFLFGAAAASFAFSQSRGEKSGLGTIAYSQAGNLWIRSLPDGEARWLVNAGGISDPQFSPSGEWISYRSRDGHFIIRRDGTGWNRSAEGWLQWMPGRDVIAASGEEGISLFDLSRGGVQTKLADGPAEELIISPDGSQLVYADMNGAASEDVDNRVGRLRRIALSSGQPEPETLFSQNEGFQMPYAFTRDGKSVLYWDSDEITADIDALDVFRVPLSGGAPQRLGVSTMVNEDGSHLSPAGNVLVYAEGSERETWDGCRIATFDLDIGKQQYLTDPQMSAVTPVWSPDGKQIVYSAAPGVDEYWRFDTWLPKRRLYIAGPSGSAEPRQLTFAEGYMDQSPRWIAGGSHLLFARLEFSGADADPSVVSLWIVDPNGGEPLQVSSRVPVGPDELSYGCAWRSFDWHSA